MANIHEAVWRPEVENISWAYIKALLDMNIPDMMDLLRNKEIILCNKNMGHQNLRESIIPMQIKEGK